MLALTETPSGVTDPALWAVGLDGKPEIGDLWLLSWNYEVLGLIVLSGIADDFVIGWPVTLPSEPAFSPAFFADSLIGKGLGVWPTRETGVGMHLLHRRFGKLLAPQLMSELGRAIDNDDDPSIDFAPTASDPSEEIEFNDQMIEHWESICFNQWPVPNAEMYPLNQQVLIDANIKPSDLAAALDISQFEATTLHRGTRNPTGEQLDVLAETTGIDAQVLASPGRDEGAQLLTHPAWKVNVIEAGMKRSVSEAQARLGIQEQFAVAARFRGSRDERMKSAIDRFMQ